MASEFSPQSTNSQNFSYFCHLQGHFMEFTNCSLCTSIISCLMCLTSQLIYNLGNCGNKHTVLSKSKLTIFNSFCCCFLPVWPFYKIMNSTASLKLHRLVVYWMLSPDKWLFQLTHSNSVLLVQLLRSLYKWYHSKCYHSIKIP